MATDMHKLILPVPDELLKEIDDYRFIERFPSRAEAVRQLLKIALKEWRKTKAQ